MYIQKNNQITRPEEGRQRQVLFKLQRQKSSAELDLPYALRLLAIPGALEYSLYKDWSTSGRTSSECYVGRGEYWIAQYS